LEIMLYPIKDPCYTTRKSTKTNGITDGKIPSEIFADGYNFVSQSVGIYRQIPSVGDTVGIYRWNMSVGTYRLYRRQTTQFFWKVAAV
jgi:hypothetical protein